MRRDKLAEVQGDPEKTAEIEEHYAVDRRRVESSLDRAIADVRGEQELVRAQAPLLPDPAQLDDHLDRLVHVVGRDPLGARVEVVLPGEDVRRRQAHEAEPRPVRPATDRLLSAPPARHGGSPPWRSRPTCGVLVEHLLHVAVGLLDLELDPCCRG